MPKNYVSVDEYIGKRSLVAKDGIVYRAAKMPKTFNAENRSAIFVMTDESVDSYGDIVRAKGAKLDRFENNPICLLNHRSDLILGTWSDVKRIVRRIEGTATIAKQGTAPHVDMAYNLMSQGILKAASIGFMPLQVERRFDDNGDPLYSYDILEWDLYECSVVSVPANPNALAKSMKDGCTLARDLLEEVLDNYIKTPTGLILNIADVEAAYKEGSAEKTAIVIDVEKSADEQDGNDPEVGKQVDETEMDETAADTEGKGVELLTDEVRDAFAAQVKDGDVVVLRDADEMKLVIERAGEVAGELVLPLDMTIRQINELSEDICERVKSREGARDEKSASTLKIEVDSTAIEEVAEKFRALDILIETVTGKVARFFGKGVAQKATPEEPPAPPSPEQIEAAMAKAAALRERLALKGLIEA